MIKIYYTDIFPLKDSSVFEQLYEKVNEQRRSKILRCKNKEDKYRSLAAGLLLRYALEQHGISYESAKIIIGENGKPYLEEPEDFYFSISHSQDIVVCAVSDKEIGVDVESVIRIDKICSDIKKRDRFLERIATKQEKEWFCNLPEEEKKKGFLRIWTGKESYGKANGKGISQKLCDVNVLNENNYLFLAMNELHYLTVYMEKIREIECQFTSIHIAKEYRK